MLVEAVGIGEPVCSPGGIVDTNGKHSMGETSVSSLAHRHMQQHCQLEP